MSRAVAVPTVDTERLLLRPWRAADLDPYARMCADPDVMRFIGDGGTLSREDAWRSMAAFAGHWSLRGFGTWAVEARDSGAMVGRIGLHQPEGWPGLEVGWTLDRSVWGRGYATEGAVASLEFAWREVGADHVISLILPDNTRSIAVAERIGETFESTTNLKGREVNVYGIARPR
jgi:RimJ/RimL family protein N-acetyltransferase